MPRLPKILLWVYIAFNLLIALTLIVQPGQVDATYQGGAMTATRRFMWFSVGSFHLLVIGFTLASMRVRRAAERRWFHLLNAGFYLGDAATQWLYWGAEVGVRPVDLHTNAGVSAVCGLLVLVAVWTDKDAPGGRPGDSSIEPEPIADR